MDSEIQFQEIIENMKERLLPLHGQIVNIGAGGMCLVAPQETEFKENGFVKLGGELEAFKIDFSGLIGQIMSFEKRANQVGFNLHVRFLPYAKDLKRQILNLVYGKEACVTKSPARSKQQKKQRNSPI